MKYHILLFIFFLSFNYAQSQGCSDAGFCTLESNNPSFFSQNNSKSNSYSLSTSYAKADHQIKVISSFITLKKQLHSKTNIEAKLSAISQTGKNIASSGLSDIMINTTYQLKPTFHFSSGIKIPLSKANKSYFDIYNEEEDINKGITDYCLPLDYQSSLGTFDLLLGMSYHFKLLHLNVAFQQPLTQNQNSYKRNDGNLNYQTTNGFERKGDFLIRFTYALKIHERISLSPSILHIYHLGNDRYNEGNNTIEITGSEGLTINATAMAEFQLRNASLLRFNLGFPIKYRDARPDGLTRKFISGIEYCFLF
jgi:hypothetical protein